MAVLRIGDRVEWHRLGAPFGGYMVGYVTALYGASGPTLKARVRSNGRSYVVDADKLTAAN